MPIVDEIGSLLRALPDGRGSDAHFYSGLGPRASGLGAILDFLYQLYAGTPYNAVSLV